MITMISSKELGVLTYTEIRFASLLSGGSTTMTIITPPERKLAKRISVQCTYFKKGLNPNI